MQWIADQIAKLEALEAPLTREPDFDAFWQEALATAADVPLAVQGGRVKHSFPGCEVHDLTFAGTDGTRVRAWLLLPPAAQNGPVPAVVEFHGAGGSRGQPGHHAAWLLAGAAVVAMDFRMQSGLTGSTTGFTAGSGMRWFNFGLEDPRHHYFLHTTLDAVRSVQLAREHPAIDPKRIAVCGGSQGGGMVLRLAGLLPDVGLCLADVPSCCWMAKRVFDRAGGADSVTDYLRLHPEKIEEALRTLSYFDNLNLAERIRCPTLISCGLRDPVCPADGIYAVYNRMHAPKRIVPYPFGEHDGGGATHEAVRLAFLRAHFG